MTFFRGAKSDSDPGALPLGYYWSAFNAVNVGGHLSCRPGYKCIAQLPAGRLQGASIFRPLQGLEQLMFCVDGVLYASPYPFTSFSMIPNVRLSPDAEQVFWCLATQSARRISSDLTSAVELISPRAVLFIQDGGLSAPAWFDGSQSGQLRDDPFALPSGGPMAWVGDRLWQARGRYVYASDIANPFSFREQIYLGGAGAFVYERDVTALTATPGLPAPQLLVFTDENCSLVKANIRDRDSWATTDDFSAEILRIGATGQRGVVSHFGQLAWFSQAGVHFLDSAVQKQLKARVALRDNEMMVSKSVLGESLRLVAGGAWGQFMLFSVPAEDTFNRHTWVLNDASIETLNDESGPSWCGYWIGTRPVEWVYGQIAGSERCYHVSTDEDGVNRLWETFRPERLDNGCPITWGVESRGYFGAATQAQKLPGSDCKFAYADLALTAIEEELDIGVFYAGGMRGAYKQIMARQVRAMRGNVVTGQEITATSDLFALKPQARKVRTEDARGQTPETDTGSCPAESDKLEDQDDSFQLLVVMHGPATIRWIRAFGTHEQEDLSGDSEACQNETGSAAIRFDGSGAKEDTDSEALASVASRPLQFFESNQTTTLTAGEFSAVGVGYATSVVSQEAADRVAMRIAVQQAEATLAGQLPPVLSAGIE